MNEEDLIAIYDFGMFPYALGDVLTFNVQTAIKCLNYEKKRIKLLICCDRNFCANFDQRGFINSKNYQYFYEQILPAFEAQCIDYEIINFDNRKKLLNHLKSYLNEKNINSENIKDYINNLKYINNDPSIYLARIANKFRKKNTIDNNNPNKKNIKKILSKKYELIFNYLNKNRNIINNYFISNIYSHQRINNFYLNIIINKFVIIGIIVIQNIHSKYLLELSEFLEKNYEEKKVISIHIRQRKNDKSFGDNESIYRDSNSHIWLDFLKRELLESPNNIFILLGRSEEKPPEILKLPNVLNLRDYGMNLGHDLAAIDKSKLFLGSSSGFAAYANFSQIPYIITNMNHNSYKAYEIPYGADSLPFSNPYQKLLFENESEKLFNTHFKLALKNHV